MNFKKENFKKNKLNLIIIYMIKFIFSFFKYMTITKYQEMFFLFTWVQYVFHFYSAAAPVFQFIFGIDIEKLLYSDFVKMEQKA